MGTQSRGSMGTKDEGLIAKEDVSPSPSLNYLSGVAGVVDSGSTSPLSFYVVERPKEFIPAWGLGDPDSQPAKTSTCHSPAVRRRIFLAASDYGVISRGLCSD